MAAGCLGLFILGIGSAAHHARPGLVSIELASAVLLGSVLIRRQRGSPAPVLPIDLFRRPIFALSTATAICSFAVQGLAFVSLPFYFEDILGRSQVETGFFMTPWPLVVAIMAPIAGRLSDRYPAGILGGFGLALLGLGMVLLAMLPANPHVADIVWRMAICGCGFGFFQAPNMKALMSSAPADRSGGASGMVATARLTGQTTGAALAALCFSLVGREGATLALVLGAGFAAIGMRDERSASGRRSAKRRLSFKLFSVLLPPEEVGPMQFHCQARTLLRSATACGSVSRRGFARRRVIPGRRGKCAHGRSRNAGIPVKITRAGRGARIGVHGDMARGDTALAGHGGSRERGCGDQCSRQKS